jgi:hypothetical protein
MRWKNTVDIRASSTSGCTLCLHELACRLEWAIAENRLRLAALKFDVHHILYYNLFLFLICFCDEMVLSLKILFSINIFIIS